MATEAAVAGYDVIDKSGRTLRSFGTREEAERRADHLMGASDIRPSNERVEGGKDGA